VCVYVCVCVCNLLQKLRVLEGEDKGRRLEAKIRGED